MCAKERSQWAVGVCERKWVRITCAAYVQFWMIAIGAAKPAGRSAASHWHLRRQTEGARRERLTRVVGGWMERRCASVRRVVAYHAVGWSIAAFG